MAKVLTGISGNVISAASAAFAPTNSADVSAIASAYQVVSATATQLYAGTAYVTSVNDAPLSASRAGQAANASLANSAYYDGTGRLISSLPDSATVSSIASSYAESAASSKQDALTFGYNTADQISSIDGSALGGMDEAAVSAIASAYAESAASGKLDKTAQVVSATGTKLYNGTYYLTSVNDNQLSAKYAVSASSATAAFYARYDRQGGVVRYLSSLPGSAEVSAIASSYAESAASSKLDATASSQFLTAIPSDYATTAYVDSSISGFAYESAVSGWTAKQDALTFGYDTANKISSIDGSAIAGGGGGVDSATVSAIASSYAESAASSKLDATAYNSADFYSTANPSGFIDSAYVDSAVSSKADSSAMSSYALSADVSGTVDLVSTQSANWGGSALALSAGPGVTLEKVGNMLVASQDRTLLWSGDLTADQIAQLTEPHTNFEILEFHHSFEGSAINQPVISYIQGGYAYTTGVSKVIGVVGPAMSLKPWEANNIYEAFGCYVTNTSATNNDQIKLRGVKVLQNGSIDNNTALYHCYAIYGINRTAEA